MKTLRNFTMLGLAVLLSGCLEATLVEERPVRHRTVAYHDGHDYHRSDYHGPVGRTQYRRYDDEEPVYRTYRPAPKPVYRRPADRVLVIQPGR